MIDPTGGPGQAGQRDPTVVYDGGAARTVVSLGGVANLTASAVTLVAAAAGVKTKVISFRASCTGFTAAGNLFLRDGAGGTSIGFLGSVSALSAVSELETSPFVVCMTSVNTLLELFFTGTANFHYQLIYYQAP